MNRRFRAPLLAVIGLTAFSTASSPAVRSPQVVDRAGNVIGTLERGPARDAGGCVTGQQQPGRVERDSRGDGFTVDACGRILRDSGEQQPFSPRDDDASALQPAPGEVTIDFMTTRRLFDFLPHVPGGPIDLLGTAQTYTLSDGSQWSSGAGSIWMYSAQLRRVEVNGTTIRYFLASPEGLIYQQIDFDSGDHSAYGSLGRPGPLVLEAQMGSRVAVLRGHARIVSNEGTWYGDTRFNFYTSVTGSQVPFQVTYTLFNDTWTPDIFGRQFSYSNSGYVDFAHPISTPEPIDLWISGPSRVPDEFTTSYRATVLYRSGAQRPATTRATWSVEPASLATITNGVLTTGTLQTQQQTLTLRAEFVAGPTTVRGEKQVLCVADDPAERPQSWPMFQGNARHTGYLPLSLNPSAFNFRWERNLGGDFELNPVAAGEGRVFATLRTFFNDVTTLFALRGSDGQTLWSTGFGDVFSVNPPSFAYGMVYVQTGNHGADTWLRAFDAATGAAVFQAPHTAQWERYFAPTVFDGKVYINGGYYGGMYGFDAYAGGMLWFAALPQYDGWTPGVLGDRAHAYVGQYDPGLYAQHRLSGVRELFVPDPQFGWDGWTMNLAPVMGAHQDVIAIHDGRLISFDTTLGQIRWEVPRQFAGQPSVAADRIYAIDDGRLVVLDEVTHADLWSWTPPSGALAGPMIVTDTHVLVSSATATYAVSLATHQSVWSYPAAGHLALADSTLYIAGADGKLTAITAPNTLGGVSRAMRARR